MDVIGSHSALFEQAEVVPPRSLVDGYVRHAQFLALQQNASNVEQPVVDAA
jgi:hypothetical protein